MSYQVVSLVMKVLLFAVMMWFGSAFLYQATKWKRLSLLFIGAGFLIMAIPFILDLLLGEWEIYNIFVWSGIALSCSQWKKYLDFLKNYQLTPRDILFYR